MIVSVWLVYKQGEPRVYTWTFLPSEDQLAIFRKDGFRIYRAELDVPVDVETTVVGAYAIEVPVKRDVVLIHGSDAPHPPQREPEPEPRKIYCPQCNTRHYDEYDATTDINWATRPHQKHLCSKCKHVWQEAEHNTVGV